MKTKKQKPEPAQAAPAADTLTRRTFLQAAGAGAVVLGFPTVLVSCSSGGGGGGGSTLKGSVTLFTSKDNSHPQEQAAIFDAVKQKLLDKHPQATFSWDTYASADEEVTKLETSAASREGPDIFEFGSTVVPTGYASNAFDMISNSMWDELGGKKAFVQAQLTLSGPSPDKLIAVPVTANPFALVYNKAMFDAAGISKPPSNWNDFISAAQEVTKPDADHWGVAMAPADGFDPWHKVWLFTTQLGGQMISPDGKHAMLDSAEVVEASGFWLDWMAKYKIASRQDATFKGADQIKAFANEKAAMLVMEGPGGIPTFDKSPVAGHYAWTVDPTVPYGMSSLPSKGKPAQGFVSGQYWTIFKYSKNKDLALELIKIYLSPEIQYQIWKTRGQTPVILDTFKKYPDTNQPPWNTFQTAEEKSYPTPFLGSWGQLEVFVGKAINKISSQIAITGGYTMADLKSALSAANQQLQASLKQS